MADVTVIEAFVIASEAAVNEAKRALLDEKSNPTFKVRSNDWFTRAFSPYRLNLADNPAGAALRDRWIEDLGLSPQAALDHFASLWCFQKDRSPLALKLAVERASDWIDSHPYESEQFLMPVFLNTIQDKKPLRAGYGVGDHDFTAENFHSRFESLCEAMVKRVPALLKQTHPIHGHVVSSFPGFLLNLKDASSAPEPQWREMVERHMSEEDLKACATAALNQAKSNPSKPLPSAWWAMGVQGGWLSDRQMLDLASGPLVHSESGYSFNRRLAYEFLNDEEGANRLFNRLTQAGHDWSALRKDPIGKDRVCGFNALHTAVQTDSVPMVRLLLQLGLDVDAPAQAHDGKPMAMDDVMATLSSDGYMDQTQNAHALVAAQRAKNQVNAIVNDVQRGPRSTML